MALWLVRAGSRGQFETRFLESDRVYLTWDDLQIDFSKFIEKEVARRALRERYPDWTQARLSNGLGQVWAFARRMAVGDWLVIPSKLKPAIHVAEVGGDYVFDAAGESRFNHFRPVRWIAKDVPRSVFEQDLLYSFGAFITICEISRNDAESRVRRLAANGWKGASLGFSGPIAPAGPKSPPEIGEGDEQEVDLERLSRDQISKLIIAKYKGHGLQDLVDAILQVQGFTTFVSPKGSDRGIDILAAPGPLGFGRPRICVQVKSSDEPVDSLTLSQLIGTMQNVQADQGLLVAWGGFKSSISREEATQFFRVRLWDQDTLISELLAHYDKLREDIQAELPLKRIWTVAAVDDPEE